MSHHSDDKAFGATGQFPHGKLVDHDEGEIQFGITADVERQVILIDFGKPVRSLGLTYDEVRGLIDTLQKKAWELRGITS
jgi:hypothetical protein